MTRFESLIRSYTPISHRLSTLEKVESSIHTRLSSQVGQHPLRRVSIKLPKSSRDIAYLWSIRELLPVTIRVEVENVYFKRVATLQGRDSIQLGRILQLVDTISSYSNPRFLEGRAKVEVSRILDSIQLNLVDPKSPKQTQRKRGYSDHGSRAEDDVRARRSANVVGAMWEESDNVRLKARDAQLTFATEILEAERRGDLPEALAGSRARLEATELIHDAQMDADLCPCSFKDDCRSFPWSCPALGIGGDPSVCERYNFIVSQYSQPSNDRPQDPPPLKRMNLF